MKTNLSKLTLVGYQSGANLREVLWNQKFLEKTAKDWQIKEGEAIIFCNVAEDRFRLVAVIHGTPILLIPPTNPENRLGIFLKINIFLRKFNVAKEIGEALNQVYENTSSRMNKRQKLANEILENKK